MMERIKNFLHSSRNIAIIMTVAALIVIGAATYSWFHQNMHLEAKDVQMNVEATSNLVIADTEEDILNMDFTKDSPFKVAFGSDSRKMALATHDLSKYATDSTVSDKETGLIYVVDTENVDDNTGMGKYGSLVYDTVPVYTATASQRYYYDYTVYISSLDSVSDNSIINASINLINTPSQAGYKACSIDFIVDGQYKGTLNYLTSGEKLNIYNGIVPWNKNPEESSKKYIKVILRCYFDGELGNGSNTFIRPLDVDKMDREAEPMTVKFARVPNK